MYEALLGPVPISTVIDSFDPHDLLAQKMVNRLGLELRSSDCR